MSASAPGSVIERTKARDAPVVAAQLEDLVDDGAVLALELGGAARRRRHVGPLLDLDPEPPSASVLGGAGDAAVQAGQRRRRRAPPGSRTRSTTSATTPTRA